ncbi:DNA-binding transcriptional activator of the SARP family [Aureimonas phyllosphaerae]|nr:DNA-binding transcriptional activator of the SARP family [Aureimonas phyllosphaerae]
MTGLAIPQKGYCLLALLLLSPGRTVERRDVKSLLWGDVPSSRQSANLRQLLLRMSKLTELSDCLVAGGETLRLAGTRWRVDVQDLLGTAAVELTSDLPAWLTSGELLEGVDAQSPAFEEWLQSARRTVSLKRAALLSGLLSDGGRAVEPAMRVRLAEALTAIDPTEGFGHRALMEAHADAGSAYLARRAWHECRVVMREEANSSPDAATHAVATRLGLGSPTRASRGSVPINLRGGAGVPRVIMMPPTGLDDEPLYERLGKALIEDVTVGLSQYRSFRIIAAHTSFELARIGKESVVSPDTQFDYEVTISVRGGSGELGASCRLTRVADREVIWAIRAPIDTTDLKKSLDIVVRKTVSTLADAMDRAESMTPVDDNDSTGYRLYLEGRRAIGGTRLESLRQARRWFKAAVRRCDGFSSAFAGLSRTYSMEWLVRGMTESQLLDESLAMANRARHCDPNSGRALRELGFVSLYRKRHAESLEHFSEARSLMPNDGDLLADYADALLHDGQADEALVALAEARRVNPLPPDYYRWIEASIHYQLEDYVGAIHALEPVSEVAATSRLMAASCAMAGRNLDARRFAAVVRENYPSFRVEQVWQIVPDRRPDDTRKLMEGLLLAGLD